MEAALSSETPPLTYDTKRCQTSEQNNPRNITSCCISNVQQTFTACMKRSVLLRNKHENERWLQSRRKWDYRDINV